MSILDFFVLEEAWSKRLRDFVKRVQSFNAKTATNNAQTSKRVDDLEADIGLLALLQVATLKLLTDKGVLRDGELVPRLAEVDMLDGVEDAKLDMSAVRRVIGLPRLKNLSKKVAAAHVAREAAATNGRRAAKGKAKATKPKKAAAKPAKKKPAGKKRG
jgi:hypothetical protein